jgi:hypothetical protein
MDTFVYLNELNCFCGFLSFLYLMYLIICLIIWKLTHLICFTISGGLFLLPFPGLLPLPRVPEAGQEEKTQASQDGSRWGAMQEEEQGGNHHLPLGVPAQATPGKRMEGTTTYLWEFLLKLLLVRAGREPPPTSGSSCSSYSR